jgi:hypothetical protein
MTPVYSYLVGGLLAKTLTAEKQQNKLNECGMVGWELIAVVLQKEGYDEYVMFYFKRPISEHGDASRFDRTIFDFAA